jgi:GAF domain-containing protein
MRWPVKLLELPLPLQLWSGANGAIHLITRPNRELDANTRRALPGIADQVSVALERARLHERLEQIVDERTATLEAEIVS